MSTRPIPEQISSDQLPSAMAQVPGWRLTGENSTLALEKDWRFASHAELMLFVNALNWIAEKLNHHPELVLNHAHCVVRWRTHDVKGLSPLDFDAARQTDCLTGTWV